VVCGVVVISTGTVVWIVEGSGVVGGTVWLWVGVVHPETSTRVTEKKIMREYHKGRGFSMNMSFLRFGYKSTRS
jgi:UDP-N-acetylenolpyruvoylglucosamine reductase